MELTIVYFSTSLIKNYLLLNVFTILNFETNQQTENIQ